MLKNRVCVKNEYITQDILDAMIAVAKASGFGLDRQNGQEVYREQHIGVSDDYGCLQNVWGNMSLDKYTVISLEDWLFSLSPCWADRLVKSDGDYWYASKVYAKKIQGGERIVYRTGFDLHTIATRKQEQWKPEVGEKCLFHVRGGRSIDKVYRECTVEYIGSKFIVVKNNHGREFSRRIAKVDLKPLLKHTEQELLAYELYQLIAIYEDSVHSIDDAKKLPFFKRYLKIVQSGRFK